MQEKLIRIRRSNLESQSVLAKLIGVDLRTYQNKEAGVSRRTPHGVRGLKYRLRLG